MSVCLTLLRSLFPFPSSLLSWSLSLLLSLFFSLFSYLRGAFARREKILRLQITMSNSLQQETVSNREKREMSRRAEERRGERERERRRVIERDRDLLMEIDNGVDNLTSDVNSITLRVETLQGQKNEEKVR
jgi:hypothetical protein